MRSRFQALRVNKWASWATLSPEQRKAIATRRIEHVSTDNIHGYRVYEVTSTKGGQSYDNGHLTLLRALEFIAQQSTNPEITKVTLTSRVIPWPSRRGN